jgi:FKBP-type peptidyl-prolyl cis-trans isomerase
MVKNICYLFLATLLVSCGADSALKTSQGYKVVLDKDVATQKCQETDFVYFDLKIFNDKDSLLQSYENAPEPLVIQIAEGGVTPDAPNPVMETISMLGAGDQASLYIPTDSIPNATPEMKESAFVRYEIVATEVMDQASFEQKMETERQEAERASMEIKEKEEEEQAKAKAIVQEYLNGKYKGDIQEDENTGLKYIILEEGEGEVGKPGQVVECNYFGYLTDGTPFDNNYKYGRAFNVNLGRGGVIPGWEIGLTKLRKNDKALLIIPSELAYGERGSPPIIPPNSELVFYMEILNIFY